MATPTVRANVGTLVKSLSKNLALATMVSFAKVLTRVLETSDEPGSLNAIWPSLPIPVKQHKILLGKQSCCSESRQGLKSPFSRWPSSESA